MIYWLRLFGLIFIFICIVAGIGYLLPRSYDFEVAQTIEADPQTVFDNFDKFPDWQPWSQWSSENPNIEFLKYSDDGDTVEWTDNRGKGVMKIIESVPGEMVRVSSNYGNFPEMISTLKVSSNAGSTVVLWQSVGRLPSGPFYGYFRPFFPNGMRAQYADSLRKLRIQCEQQNESAVTN